MPNSPNNPRKRRRTEAFLSEIRDIHDSVQTNAFTRLKIAVSEKKSKKKIEREENDKDDERR